MRKVGKICRKNPGGVLFCGFFPRGKIILVVLEIPDNIWYFLKTKGGNYYY